MTAGWHILVQSRNCVIATSHVMRLPSLMSAARQVGPWAPRSNLKAQVSRSWF